MNRDLLETWITQIFLQAFGWMSMSIKMDILDIKKGGYVYIRVPFTEGPRCWVALSGYSGKGIQVLGVSDHLMGLIHQSRQEINQKMD